MAISKRTRFEILRRDGYRCKYCGLEAADGTGLTIDHVTPTALGGGDDPSNLVAACRDCNAGKTSTSPDGPLVEDVQADALRWRGAMYLAAADMAVEIEVATRYRDAFEAAWLNWVYGYRELTYDLPSTWSGTVDNWRLAGMPLEILVDSIRIAMNNQRVAPDAKFVYLCGITKNRLEKIHQGALEKAREPIGEPPCAACEQTPCCDSAANCDHASAIECAMEIGEQGGWRRGYERFGYADVPHRILISLADNGYEKTRATVIRMGRAELVA